MQLPDIIAGILGKDVNAQQLCTQQCRRMLSKERNPPIDEIIEAKIVPRLVEFLDRSDKSVFSVLVVLNTHLVARVCHLQSITYGERKHCCNLVMGFIFNLI